jgi:hypothetical protein
MFNKKEYKSTNHSITQQLSTVACTRCEIAECTAAGFGDTDIKQNILW